jgi:hypothetical protein
VCRADVPRPPAPSICCARRKRHLWPARPVSLNHVRTAQAASVRASLLGNASTPTRHLLQIPAPRDCLQRHGPQLDFGGSRAEGLPTERVGSFQGHGARAAPPRLIIPPPPSAGSAACDATAGAVYPDAIISDYLPRYRCVPRCPAGVLCRLAQPYA